jgi:AhpD family alkylhydroperoxidase
MNVLTAYAPNAARALGEIERATWGAARRAGIDDLAGLVNRVCAAQIRLAPLDRDPEGAPAAPTRWARADGATWREIDGLSPRDQVALRFAEQFSVDVASVTPHLRAELIAEFGAGVGDFVAIVFAMDFLPRTRAGLEALLGQGAGTWPHSASEDTDPPEIWEALDDYTRVVPALGSLDPVLTELVRLRGARQHRCRLCTSLRSRPALMAGADESTLAKVLGEETEGLTPVQRAAIGFTDAMIWTPAAFPQDAVAALSASLEVGQRIELVLDITRNALNKVAVALGADAPHVESGVEIYDVDPEGNLLYGLTLD